MVKFLVDLNYEVPYVELEPLTQRRWCTWRYNLINKSRGATCIHGKYSSTSTCRLNQWRKDKNQPIVKPKFELKQRCFKSQSESSTHSSTLKIRNINCQGRGHIASDGSNMVTRNDEQIELVMNMKLNWCFNLLMKNM